MDTLIHFLKTHAMMSFILNSFFAKCQLSTITHFRFRYVLIRTKNRVKMQSVRWDIKNLERRTMSRHKCRFRFEIKIHIGYILKATDIRTLVSNAIGILKVYPTNTHAYPFTPLHTHVPPHTPEHTNTNPRTPTRAHSHTPVRTPDIPAHENVNRVNNFLSN